ncbi:MAG: multiheme c-type cytochrome [Candidatus Methanoperedens sp.]|nr:multiheme c-type cytochrome [Candidatus Methanoperedens sp.]
MILATIFSMTLALSGMVYDNGIETSDYVHPEVCGGCHEEIYAQWNGSMHSMAHKDPVYEKLFVIASRETNSSFDAFCTKCHAPIDYLSGKIPSADNYNVSEISEKGVSCDFCHTVNATSGIGNGAFISSPGRIKRGPLNDSNYSTFHSTVYSDLYTKSDFCGICHNVVHPFNGLVLENTYTEWKEGPYNETTSCQDCHMTPGVTRFVPNPGRAAVGGPIRENIFTHYFVGGNAMLPGLLGSPEHEKLAQERLKSAATLEIEAIEVVNDNVTLRLKVTNTGAGHKLPTGLTEARLIWLDVEVRDASGKAIFRSGGVDENGYIDHDAVKYHTVFGDASGKHTEKVWFAQKILSDNRIPPKGYSIEYYNFTIPKTAKRPVILSARLNYVSASQELSDLLFGKGKVRPPVVEMTSANYTLYAPSAKETPDFSFVMAIFTFYITVRFYKSRR